MHFICLDFNSYIATEIHTLNGHVDSCAFYIFITTNCVYILLKWTKKNEQTESNEMEKAMLILRC